MARRALYEKNEAYKRTIHDTEAERDAGYARLLDLKGRKKVEMFWSFNDEAAEDGVFKLRVDGVEVYLDAEQFGKYLRWV